MKNQNENLITFALYTLLVMQKNKNWDADMFNALASLSNNLGLSDVDEQGLFVKTAERN